MATALEQFKLSGVLGFIPYLIGGSYVVDPINANDIDLIVHQYHDEDGTLSARLVNKHGFRTLSGGKEKYDEIDKIRLCNVYEGFVEGQKINVIVVGASFWPAYVGAIRRMQARPDLYMTREQRIELHRSLSKQCSEIAMIHLEDDQD